MSGYREVGRGIRWWKCWCKCKKSLRDKTINTCAHVYSRILLPRLTFMHPPSNLETHLPTHDLIWMKRFPSKEPKRNSVMLWLRAPLLDYITCHAFPNLSHCYPLFWPQEVEHKQRLPTQANSGNSFHDFTFLPFTFVRCWVVLCIQKLILIRCSLVGKLTMKLCIVP